jgi:hypothetical protein
MGNPFEPTLSAEFQDLQEESIDFYILGIQRANELSWQFNPWYHRLPNYLLSLFPKRKPRFIFDEDYIGLDRRKTNRLQKLANSGINAVKLLLMTKTQKIRLNSEEEVCDISTWPSPRSLSDVEFKRTGDQSLIAFSRWTGSNTMSISSKSKQLI